MVRFLSSQDLTIFGKKTIFLPMSFTLRQGCQGTRLMRRGGGGGGGDLH